jgi:hypothetical protein
MIKRIMVVVYILLAFFAGMKVHSMINKCDCQNVNTSKNQENVDVNAPHVDPNMNIAVDPNANVGNTNPTPNMPQMPQDPNMIVAPNVNGQVNPNAMNVPPQQGLAPTQVPGQPMNNNLPPVANVPVNQTVGQPNINAAPSVIQQQPITTAPNAVKLEEQKVVTPTPVKKVIKKK